MKKPALIAVVTVLALAGGGYYFFISKPTNPTAQVNNPTTSIAYENCVKDFSADLCGMFEPQKKIDLYKKCASAEIPQTADDSTLYPDQKIAVVRWWDNDRQNNVTLYLPYEPETGFAGCSKSAKEKLEHIQSSAIPQ